MARLVRLSRDLSRTGKRHLPTFVGLGWLTLLELSCNSWSVAAPSMLADLVVLLGLILGADSAYELPKVPVDQMWIGGEVRV